MSYDLMVFKAEVPPKNRVGFMDWYKMQTQWGEDHGYNNPEVTTLQLRNWMMEMIQTFPAQNGPYAKTGERKMADYNIGKELIYITFSWADKEEAYRLTRKLALKHKVGFFDVSAPDGEILFP